MRMYEKWLIGSTGNIPRIEFPEIANLPRIEIECPRGMEVQVLPCAPFLNNLYKIHKFIKINEKRLDISCCISSTNNIVKVKKKNNNF